MKFRLELILVLAPVLLYLTGCGSSSSSSALGLTTAAISSSGTIASPFEASSGSAVTTGERNFYASTLTDRAAAIDSIVNATSLSGCAFSIDLSQGSNNANCYGPSIPSGILADHPDASSGPDNLPGGDLGLWNAEEKDGSGNDTGEACTAAQINSLVDQSSKFPYIAQLLAARMYCVIQNSSSYTLPIAGSGSSLALTASDISFTDSASGELTVDTFGSASAAVASVTDISSGSDEGYRFELTGDITDGSVTYEFKIIVQRLANFSASTEKGKISYVFQNPTATMDGNCTSGAITTSGGMTEGGVLVFNRDASSSTADEKIEFNRAQFCGAVDPLDSNYDVDPTSKADVAANGWGADWHHLLFQWDPASLVGNFLYRWQAGRSDGNTRVFNASVTSGSPNTGVGYFGFGPDMATTLGSSDSWLQYMICNWAGPGSGGFGSKTTQAYMQKQTMSYDTTNSVWTSTAANIQYAPTNSCAFDPATFATFAYNTQAGTYDNDSGELTLSDTASSIDLAAYDQSVLPTVTEPTF